MPNWQTQVIQISPRIDSIESQVHFKYKQFLKNTLGIKAYKQNMVINQFNASINNRDLGLRVRPHLRYEITDWNLLL